MLLSQRIAKNVELPYMNTARTERAEQLEIRKKILAATKIIAPKEIFDFSVDAYTQMRRQWGNEENISDAKRMKRIDLYRRYVKMPFEMLFIENGEEGMLVEHGSFTNGTADTQVYEFKLTSISCYGYVQAMRVLAHMLDVDDPRPHSHAADCIMSQADVNTTYRAIEHEYATKMGVAIDQEYFNIHLFNVMNAAIQTVFETLLFMNVSNSELHLYRPSRKEKEKIPKVFHPYLEYHVLDIYRTKKVYKSLEDIEVALNPSDDIALRRAHLVRGHFKSIRGRLFWWNPFMRNAKNIATAGFVDKDYNLKNE